MASLVNYLKANKPSTLDVTKGFPVDNVKKATDPLPSKDWKEVVASRCGGVVSPEAFSKPTGDVIVGTSNIVTHGFVAAVNLAYSKHYPLAISPDDIWLCIAQGFAAHVNANAERLRHHFVEFEGKKEISIRRDGFVKGSPDNPWEGAFSEFSDQIKDHIGEKTHSLLSPTFTTTGPTQKAAAEIVLMNAFKQYFDFKLYTMCGIPEVILKGTVDDWKQLREKALELAQFELDWWITGLSPVLDQLVATAEGQIDNNFWSSMYKKTGGSGGPYITGWILKLFPYIGDNMERRFDIGRGQLTSRDLPPGMSSVPFVWEYLNKTIDMSFFAGFMGVAQDSKTLCISAEVGWAVAQRLETKVAKNL